MEEAYTKTVDEVLKLLGTDVNTGLYDEQVLKSLRTYGPNGIDLLDFLAIILGLQLT